MEISEAIGEAADRCAQIDLDAVDATRLRTSLAEFRSGLSRLEASFARMTHAAQRAGAHLGTGARDTAEWVGRETGTSTHRNRIAAELGEAMSKSTELADAGTSGRISNDKAAAAVGAADGIVLDAAIIDEISELPLNSVRPAAENWRARNDAANEASRAERQRARRVLHLTGQADGMTRIDGLLEPDSA
ncbi:MAG: hypothetical protein ABJ314_12770 [Ilumatobacter sp.]|uniref:hypothetical protein n=1 Tax=Ilumatobacter sp. TaxID=1967498 RepID=UPI003298580D